MTRDSAFAMQTICIGVPTYRRADNLADLLTKLTPLLATRPHVRVSIVNDGSHDASYESLINGSPFHWLSYRTLNENVGCGGARRATFEDSGEDWLVSIDDDCVPSAEWIEMLEALTNGGGVDFFAGEVFPTWTTTPTSYEEDLACIDNESSLVETPHGLMTAVTANLVMRRTAYERAGGFAVEMRGAEDCDLTQRLISSGATYRICRDLVIKHIAQKRYSAMRRRFQSYGYFAARYVLLRQNWRISEQQPSSGYASFLSRLSKKCPVNYRAARENGFSRWRSTRRAFFIALMSTHYELSWHRSLRRESRVLGLKRPTAPKLQDQFVDFE